MISCCTLRTIRILATLVVAFCSAATSAATVESDYRDAVLAMRARQYAEAAAGFEGVLDREPRSVKTLLNLGICRAALSDWPAAVAAYERLLAIEPGHAKALNNLANVYFRQGLYEEAAAWYAKALAADPDYLNALYHHGWLMRHLDRADLAEPPLARCLEVRATDDEDRARQLDCLFVLATLRFRAGRTEEAAAMFERVVAILPAHAEARYYLGMSYRKLGRTEEALAQLETHRRLVEAARSPTPIEKRTDR